MTKPENSSFRRSKDGSQTMLAQDNLDVRSTMMLEWWAGMVVPEYMESIESYVEPRSYF